MAQPQIRTEGFRELSRALKKTAGDFQKRLKETNYKVADFVSDEAKGKARGLGGVAAKAAPSLRATKTAAYAAVRLGGRAYPWALGAEFGSKKYAQFKPYRGNMNDSGSFGYFLGPSIRNNREKILMKWNDGVDDILKDAFHN